LHSPIQPGHVPLGIQRHLPLASLHGHLLSVQPQSYTASAQPSHGLHGQFSAQLQEAFSGPPQPHWQVFGIEQQLHEALTHSTHLSPGLHGHSPVVLHGQFGGQLVAFL